MTIRAYKGILGLLIEASTRFYMLSPRCWPLLAGTECMPGGPEVLECGPRRGS